MVSPAACAAPTCPCCMPVCPALVSTHLTLPYARMPRPGQQELQRLPAAPLARLASPCPRPSIAVVDGGQAASAAAHSHPGGGAGVHDRGG